MNIRTKMISLLALLFAVLIVLEISIQQRVLMPSFAQLEREDAETSMKRIGNALDMSLENLESFTYDWGNWADLYRFVQSPDPAFVNGNVTPAALKPLNVNAVIIVDLRGAYVFSTARTSDTWELLDLDLAARKTLPEDFPWRKNLADGKPTRGLLRTSRGIMMLAASPVLDGSGAGKSSGMVLMGRLMTPEQLQRLGTQAQASVTMLPQPPSGASQQIVETDTATQVFKPFTDIYGKPLMSLRVDVPRRISARGRGAVTYASLYLIGAAVTVLLLLVVALNRIVLKPLARVTRHAVAVGEGTDLSARLNIAGQDEIAMLAREFDRMVERQADSRRQLVDQSFQSGFAELAKGVLHNLGNAMTPLVVRLSTLGDRLRDAPAGDVQLAFAELAHEQESARRMDLEEFLRLACRELALCVKDARNDAAVVQRQATIVQTALSELMRSTRNAHVVESVRLPELVAQTLEIVPDACRHRLVVDTDESLRKVGAVQVARTVLRLILQNLIINAADAVRDAGRDKGVLHFAAEITGDSGHEQLHLLCKDDGVGIAPDNLQRVFDKDFSTKSRETNYGIGLHWCANAIGALGGRIWAASEGPGLGASMHLMLPLPVRDSRSNT
jgi:sensor domain CHASE-containing protein